MARLSRLSRSIEGRVIDTVLPEVRHDEVRALVGEEVSRPRHAQLLGSRSRTPEAVEKG
jgi:predicted transcriptional regulator